MRHNLIVCYCLSLLILGTILFISIVAGPVRNTIFYKGSLETVNFTSAFSKNVEGSYLLNLFGSAKIMMILLSTVGFVLHGFFLYKLLWGVSNKTKRSYLSYWGVLFLPYVVILLVTI